MIVWSPIQRVSTRLQLMNMIIVTYIIIVIII